MSITTFKCFHNLKYHTTPQVGNVSFSDTIFASRVIGHPQLALPNDGSEASFATCSPTQMTAHGPQEFPALISF